MTGPLPYRLVATDLDGTLLGPDHTVSQRSRAALAAATAAGAGHIIVTGRPVARTVHVLEDLGYQGLAVCMQGAQVYHAGERRLLTSVTLDRQTARTALAKIEAETGPLAVAAALDGVDGDIVLGPGYRLFDSELPVGGAVDDVEELWASPVSKLYVQHPRMSDDELAQAATTAAGGLVSAVMSGSGIVELLPLGLSKARGLSLAARRLGVTAARTIAFGDMPNDLPMFEWAGHGVAMGNAHPLLKAAADEVTAANGEDGIALVLERLFPGA
ncbi:HAD family hydrolase [Streptomyces sp. ME03-5709C]|nr:HAD family hydrolase [Streptomyces sp. ME03-5709C]